MWKRIHSNRDPRDTLGSELKKEFSRYVDMADENSRRMAARYPKLLFGMMVALLAASLVLSFTVFRHHQEVKLIQAPRVSPLRDGVSQMLRAAEKIRETMTLKHYVDSISSKKVLTATDSVALDRALTRLESLRATP